MSTGASYVVFNKEGIELMSNKKVELDSEEITKLLKNGKNIPKLEIVSIDKIEPKNE